MNEELLKRAKNAQSVEELLLLAKKEKIELNEEQAREYFAKLHPSMGELADDELDSVSGGGCGGEPDYILPTYQLGDIVAVKSADRCDACGCESGKIVGVFKGSYNSLRCIYYYTLIVTVISPLISLKRTAC